MSDYVIDASAVLVSLFAEPGADLVDAYAAEDNRLLITSVNLSEAVSKLLDRGVPLEAIEQALLPLGLEEVAFGSDLSRIAAQMRPATRRFGLSLGDRCCLALAKARGAAVLTADRNWLSVAGLLGVEVILTRPSAA